MPTLKETGTPSKNDKLIEKVTRNLQERSEKSLEIAKEKILSETVECKEINEAFRHYAEIWYDYIHPGLVSIACEAVGGDPERAVPMQVVMLLLSAACDLHDDVIDESKMKYGKPTVFGKFGKDITLLVGDAFMMKALALLHKLEKEFAAEKMNMMWNIISSRFFELGDAEALEVSLKGSVNISPEMCFGIIEKKASSFEANMRIGAIIGGAETSLVDMLGNYGKTIGILLGVRDEFIDIFEPDELQNRVKNELPPLPILYTICACKSSRTKKVIIDILSRSKISDQDAEKIVDIVYEEETVKKFINRIQSLAEKTLNNISTLQNKNVRSQMQTLILSLLEDL